MYLFLIVLILHNITHNINIYTILHSIYFYCVFDIYIINAALWADDFFQKPFKNIIDPKLLNSILWTLTGLDILFIEMSSHNVPLWTLKGEEYDFCATALYLNAKIMIVSKQVSQKHSIGRTRSWYVKEFNHRFWKSHRASVFTHFRKSTYERFTYSCHYLMHFNIRIITHFTFTVK